MGLVAYYPLNGNSQDYITEDFATVENVIWTDGKVGDCGSFNGTTSQIIIPDEPKYKSRSEISAAAWVYSTRNLAARQVVLMVGRDMSSGYLLLTDDGTTFRARINTSGGQVEASATVTLNTWNHFAFSYSYETGLRLYLNGALISEQPANGTITYPEIFGDGNSIGAHGGQYYFEGFIDEVELYNHVLSVKEVQNIYRALYFSASLRYSSNSNVKEDTITEVGTVTFNNGFIGTSSGGIEYNNLDARITEATVSIYARLDAVGLNQVLDTSLPRGIVLKWQDNSSSALVGGFDGSFVTVPITYTLGQEIHIVMTYDGSTQKFFIDGQKVQENAKTGAFNLSTLYVGKYFANSDYDFEGKLRDAQVFQRLFSETEVYEFSRNAMSIHNTGIMQPKYLIETGNELDFLSVRYDSIQIGEFSEIGAGREMVNWLPFNDSNVDKTGIGTDATLNNGAFVDVDGLFVDGTDDYATISQPDLDFSSHHWTVSFLIYPLAIDGTFVVSPNSAGVDHGFRFGGSGNISMLYAESADTNTRAVTGSLPLNEWTHVVGQIDENLTARLFINGELVDEETNTIPIAYWTDGWSIGQRANATFYSNFRMKNFKVFDSVLTVQEIGAEYRMGKASVNKNTAYAKEIIEG